MPSTATLAEAEQLVHRSGHSRVLVTDGGRVNGFLHAKDLLRVATSLSSDLLPAGLVRLGLWVRPDEPISEVLLRMRRARRHVAVVAGPTRRVGRWSGSSPWRTCWRPSWVTSATSATVRAPAPEGTVADADPGGELGPVVADAVRRAVAARAGSGHPGGARIVSVRRLSGGASRLSWMVGTDPGPGVVVQRERGGSAGANLPMEEQAGLLRAAHAAGVPVPEVLASGRDGEAGFVVLSVVEGESVPRRVLRSEELAPAREGLARRAGEVLARVQRVGPARAPGLPAGRPPGADAGARRRAGGAPPGLRDRAGGGWPGTGPAPVPTCWSTGTSAWAT